MTVENYVIEFNKLERIVTSICSEATLSRINSRMLLFEFFLDNFLYIYIYISMLVFACP